MTRRAAFAAAPAALVAFAGTPLRVLAHGGVTGTKDLVQDYGVLVFLVAVVLVGAGVVAWVTRVPPADDEGEGEPV
jgi:hypothetical protein